MPLKLEITLPLLELVGAIRALSQNLKARGLHENSAYPFLNDGDLRLEDADKYLDDLYESFQHYNKFRDTILSIKENISHELEYRLLNSHNDVNKHLFFVRRFFYRFDETNNDIEKRFLLFEIVEHAKSIQIISERIDEAEYFDVARSPAPVELEEEDLKKPFESKSVERPRWAEENRPNKRVDFMIDENLLSNIERAARAAGLDRTAWLSQAFERFLREHPGQMPPNFPSHGKKEPTFVRLDPGLLERVDAAAKHCFMKRSPWMRAVAYFLIHQPEPIPVAGMEQQALEK